MNLQVNEVFAEIGEDGFQEIVSDFYRRIPHDDILGPMYPAEDLAGAEKRLLDFLVYRFGGPDRYLTERGHPRLRIRHAPFAVNQVARNRWVALMSAAIKSSSVSPPAKKSITEFLDGVATFLINS